VVKALEDFVPVIVDGDVEKAACGKFQVSGFPDLHFLDASGKELGAVGGYVPTAEFLKEVQAARAKLGKEIKLTPAYAKLLKSRQAMDKALQKKDYAAALGAIQAIGKAKHEGPESRAAAKAREEITALAKESLEKAEALATDGKTKDALTAFQKTAKDFKGLPEGDEAAKRADEIRKALAPPK
jgi:hypothetical protein